MAETCYACDLPATTREHVPPKSFFPTEKRDQLFTVPSCETHNNDNSPDVDYVRNLLSFQYGTNEDGRSQFNGVVQRSLARSPGLKVTMLRSMETVQVDDTFTGQIRPDRQRIGRIMEAVARAIHFKDTGEKISDWTIINEFLDGVDEAGNDIGGALRFLGKALDETANVVEKDTGNPTVFKYRAGTVDSGKFGRVYVYTFVFYQTTVVKALSFDSSGLLASVVSTEADSGKDEFDGEADLA